jgi:hypothetical protein
MATKSKQRLVFLHTSWWQHANMICHTIWDANGSSWTRSSVVGEKELPQIQVRAHERHSLPSSFNQFHFFHPFSCQKLCMHHSPFVQEIQASHRNYNRWKLTPFTCWYILQNLKITAKVVTVWSFWYTLDPKTYHSSTRLLFHSPFLTPETRMNQHQSFGFNMTISSPHCFDCNLACYVSSSTISRKKQSEKDQPA